MRLQTVAIFTLAALIIQIFAPPTNASSMARPSSPSPLLAQALPSLNSSSGQNYTDLQGHWARGFVEALSQRAIISGFADGTFRPDAPVNRAEFAAIVDKAFRRNPTRERIEFSDVPTTYWAYGAIQAAYQMRFLGAYGGSQFNPEQLISRVQVVVSLVNGLGLAPSGATTLLLNNYFQDADSIPEYAQPAVAAAIANQLIIPPENAVLNPNQVASRADVAALVYQALAISGGLSQPVQTATRPTPAPNPTQEATPPPPPVAQPVAVRSPQPLPRQYRNTTIDETYTLGAGDRINLSMLIAPEYNGDRQVLVDGTLNLPLVGSVRVAGMTLQQAGEAITARYAYYVRDPVVTVNLVTPRPLKLAVSGEVNRPGSYTIPLAESAQFPSVTQLIEQAGGMTQAADLRAVQVRRPQPSGAEQIITVDLWALLRQGDLSQDMTLRDGDVLYIPTAEQINLAEANEIGAASFASDGVKTLNVTVVGEVSRPGPHTVTGSITGDNNSGAIPTVTRAIQAAGGITQAADLQQVQIRRLTRSGTQQVITVNLWQLLRAGDASQDAILQQGDTIFIPTAANLNLADATQLAAASFANDSAQTLSITVVGEVVRPGPHTLSGSATGTDGSAGKPTVTRAIQEAGGITQSADLRQVQIRRLTQSGAEQMITVDLWQLLRAGDVRQDILLQPGDIVFIPTANNISVAEANQLMATSLAGDRSQPLNITVVGEVDRPGPHIVTSENAQGDNSGSLPTVTRAIQIAGGITQSADIRQVQVRRPRRDGTEQLITVDLWQLLQTGDSRQDVFLQQGDTIIVPTATTLTAAEVTELASASFSPDAIAVNVVGEVVRPGAVQIPPNTPLNQALLAAGGFNNRARKGSVQLLRLNPNGTVSRRTVEVDFESGINDQNNPTLRPNDVVVVGRSGLASVSDTVGEVLRPVGQVFSIFNFFRIFD